MHLTSFLYVHTNAPSCGSTGFTNVLTLLLSTLFISFLQLYSSSRFFRPHNPVSARLYCMCRSLLPPAFLSCKWSSSGVCTPINYKVGKVNNNYFTDLHQLHVRTVVSAAKPFLYLIFLFKNRHESHVWIRKVWALQGSSTAIDFFWNRHSFRWVWCSRFFGLLC